MLCALALLTFSCRSTPGRHADLAGSASALTSATTSLDAGPMVGAVDAERARIWTRIPNGEARVHWESVAGQGVTGWAGGDAGRDHVRVFEIGPLPPLTRVSYWVEARDGVRLGAGGFRTPPHGGERVDVRIAAGSCAEFDEQPIFASVLAEEPDVFLFLGDNNYANSADVGRLRRVYRHHRLRPHRRDLVANTSTLATWDDHDYLGNDTNGRTPGREDALRVFHEWWANPRRPDDAPPGTYFRTRWGDVELFVLDGRYNRGLDGRLLGAAQADWLLDALRSSDAAFKVVALGSRWTLNDRTDAWRGYEAERDAVLASWGEAGIEGVVLLSGDSHTAELRQLPVSDRVGYDVPEVVSSTLASHPQACRDDDSAEPDLLHCATDAHHFVTLSREAAGDDTLTVRVHTADGVRATWVLHRDALTRGGPPLRAPDVATP